MARKKEQEKQKVEIWLDEGDTGGLVIFNSLKDAQDYMRKRGIGELSQKEHDPRRIREDGKINCPTVRTWIHKSGCEVLRNDKRCNRECGFKY